MKDSSARFLLGIGIPVASIATIVVSYVATRSQLPDRLATHFDASGTPDGSMAPGAFLALTLVMSLAGVVASVWLARSSRTMLASVASIVGFLGGFFAALGAAIAAVTFFSQSGLASWEEAGSVAVLIVVPLVVATALGAIGARSATALPSMTQVASPGSQPVMDLTEGQNAVWAETLHSKLIARLAVVVLIGGVLAALATSWWLLLPALASAVIMLSLATLQVRADRRGLHVKYGLLPWPRTNVAVDQIDTATVIDVRPMEWGGWGYRGSLKLMKQAAVVHRAGPGIRLDLRDGKVFVVTVDNPETAVALLNAEVARSPQPV